MWKKKKRYSKNVNTRAKVPVKGLNNIQTYAKQTGKLKKDQS